MGKVTRRVVLGGAVSMAAGALAGCSSASAADASSTVFLFNNSASMEPTLVKDQSVAADLVVPGKYEPRRQDIVFFHPPAAWREFDVSQLFVSRVIGIPGDTVYCDGPGAPVVLNGVALKEPYLYKGDSPSTINFRVTVPSGHLWTLDDHRSIGLDCRYQLHDPNNGAFVPIANVVDVYHPKS